MSKGGWMITQYRRGIMETNGKQSTYLTVKDVADRLNIHARTVRRLIVDGELTAIKVGKRGDYRISPEALTHYELQNKTN